jgi:Amidohydrolase family
MSKNPTRRDFLKSAGAFGLSYALAGCGLSTTGDSRGAGDPEMIVSNGRIATVDGPRPFVQAVAIQNGRFLAVGSNEEIMRLRSAKTEVIDLGGRTVIPGLNDSHMHPIRGGLNYNMELRWDGVPSLADALRMLKEQAAEHRRRNGCAWWAAGRSFNLPSAACRLWKKSMAPLPTLRFSSCIFMTARF